MLIFNSSCSADIKTRHAFLSFCTALSNKDRIIRKQKLICASWLWVMTHESSNFLCSLALYDDVISATVGISHSSSVTLMSDYEVNRGASVWTSGGIQRHNFIIFEHSSVDGIQLDIHVELGDCFWAIGRCWNINVHVDYYGVICIIA